MYICEHLDYIIATTLFCLVAKKNSQSSWFRLGKAFLDESRTTHQKVDEARRWRPLLLHCPACQQLTTLHRLSYSTVCFGKVSTAFPDSSILCTLHWSAAEIQGCSFSFVGRCVHIFVRVPVKLTLFTHTKHNQNANTLKLIETNTKITKNGGESCLGLLPVEEQNRF